MAIGYGRPPQAAVAAFIATRSISAAIPVFCDRLASLFVLLHSRLFLHAAALVSVLICSLWEFPADPSICLSDGAQSEAGVRSRLFLAAVIFVANSEQFDVEVQLCYYVARFCFHEHV
jgi:hypothetical protein